MKRSDRYFRILYIAVLLVYPLVGVTQGLSTLDTTYSPANFIFHRQMDGTWIVATYLANALGHLITCLPGGATLLGVRIYTSLIVGITAVIAYCILSGRLGVHITFIGEFIAIGLCWCPTTILYNYLTYLLMTAGVMLLYTGLQDHVPQGLSAADDASSVPSAGLMRQHPRSEVFLASAGLVFGLNVLTRLPNVTECAFIILVWYAGFIRHEKVSSVVRRTLICIAGYAAGFLIGFICICVRFGAGAYGGMIGSLFAMTDTATDYKPGSMITAMFEDYIYAGRWILLWLGATLIAGIAAYLLIAKHEGSAGDRGASDAGHVSAGRMKLLIPVILITSAVYALVIRICYGQGMFSFRYYEYGSMYFWAVILLCCATVLCICAMVIYRNDPSMSLLALTAFITIYITPVGSNNGLYPIVNNMFIVAPVVIAVAVRMIRECVNSGTADAYGTAHPVRRAAIAALSVTALMLAAGTLIQSVGFKCGFAFDDGIDGTPRDAYVTGHPRIGHIRTTAAHAAALQGLLDYMEDAPAQALLLYGDIPGLGYVLDTPSALSTFWPDLDSYNYSEWTRDMERLETAFTDTGTPDSPVIIVSLPVAAWIDSMADATGQSAVDTEAIDHFGIDIQEYAADRKLSDLVDLIYDHGYTQTYANDGYAVYRNQWSTP